MVAFMIAAQQPRMSPRREEGQTARKIKKDKVKSKKKPQGAEGPT
jgi:hypothetical protein